MKRKSSITCFRVAAVAMLLTVSLTSKSNADRIAVDKKGGKSASVSGVFSGTLSGNVRIGRNTVVIGPRTQIYVTGRGMAKTAPYLNSVAVSVLGTRRGDTIIAQTIIVRGRPNKPRSADDVEKLPADVDR